MFKQLEKMGRCFDLDPTRTILVDDSAYKGCVSPSSNCIFLPTFDLCSENNKILLGELLPYLTRLDEADDVRSVMVSDLYGHVPVVQGQKLFSKFVVVIET